MQEKRDDEIGLVPKRPRWPVRLSRSARLGVTILVVIVAWAAWMLVTLPRGEKMIVVDGQPLAMVRLETEEEITLGLSDRPSMPRDQGMLFVFKEKTEACMWMKDMRFSIDMVWLDENRRIIKIKENVAPETYPESFCSSTPAAYVIELNAGVAKHAGLQVGDRLTIH